MGGVLGLADVGPQGESRVSATVDGATGVDDVTLVCVCSDAAVESFRAWPVAGRDE